MQTESMKEETATEECKSIQSPRKLGKVKINVAAPEKKEYINMGAIHVGSITPTLKINT